MGFKIFTKDKIIRLPLIPYNFAFLSFFQANSKAMNLRHEEQDFLSLSHENLFELIFEVSQEINSILSLDELMEKIGETTRRFIDYQIFAILLVDEIRQDLYWRFTLGYPEIVKGKHIKLGEGLVGTAAARRESILVSDVTRDSRYIDLIEGVRSELAIPLMSRNRPGWGFGHRKSASQLFSTLPSASVDAAGFPIGCGDR